MDFVVPITVDSTNLATNLTNEASDWTAGTYSTGTQKVEGEFLYEVVASPNTTDQPSVGAAKTVPTWTLVGYANKWRMWREGVDSISSKVGNIVTTVTIGSALTTMVGVLNVDALSVTVRMTDPVEGEVYNETKNVADIGVGDWWEYFFTDYSRNKALVFDNIPAYSGTGVKVAITITAASGGDTVSVGRVVLGRAVEIGQSLAGVNSRNISFSKKERDEFGYLTLVNRRTIRVVEFPVMIESTKTNAVQRQVADLDVTPTLFIADKNKAETIVFGVCEDFAIIINGLSVTECNISVEEF